MEVSLTFAELMTAGRPLHSMTISLYMTSAASRPAHATRSPVPLQALAYSHTSAHKCSAQHGPLYVICSACLSLSAFTPPC